MSTSGNERCACNSAWKRPVEASDSRDRRLQIVNFREFDPGRRNGNRIDCATLQKVGASISGVIATESLTEFRHSRQRDHDEYQRKQIPLYEVNRRRLRLKKKIPGTSPIGNVFIGADGSSDPATLATGAAFTRETTCFSGRGQARFSTKEGVPLEFSFDEKSGHVTSSRKARNLTMCFPTFFSPPESVRTTCFPETSKSCWPQTSSLIPASILQVYGYRPSRRSYFQGDLFPDPDSIGHRKVRSFQFFFPASLQKGLESCTMSTGSEPKRGIPR